MSFRGRTDELQPLLSGSGDPRLVDAVATIRSAFAEAEVPALPAGPELADVLFSGVDRTTARADAPAPWTGPPVRSRSRRRRVVAGVLVASLVSGGGLAGALPGPAQTAFDWARTTIGFDAAPAPSAPAGPATDVPERPPGDPGPTPSPDESPTVPPPAAAVGEPVPAPLPPRAPAPSTAPGAPEPPVPPEPVVPVDTGGVAPVSPPAPAPAPVPPAASPPPTPSPDIAADPATTTPPPPGATARP
jgi:hypothetical protein